MDSTPLTVCENTRINRHRTFRAPAGQDKLLGDRGYISKFYKELLSIRECEMITLTRSSMPQSDFQRKMNTICANVI